MSIDDVGFAILLLLIALFMILYILLLPPEQRDDILNQSVSNGLTEDDVQTKVLFVEKPIFSFTFLIEEIIVSILT